MKKEKSHLEIIYELSKKSRLEVYLVGGFIRDLLLGRGKLDFDFAVHKDALKLAKSFARKIKGAYVLLDEERNCARVCKKTKEGLATYDFADFRAKTFKGDLNKRDFTINTFALEIKNLSKMEFINDVLIDHKSARKDLDAKKIKMVSKSAFKEDPLRILRAYSLKAQYGFRIEKNTLAQMKKDAKLLRDVSSERIRDELFKVLASEKCGTYLKQMSRDGILDIVIPQLRIMHNCRQGTYHHLDVWPHSLQTVVELDKLLIDLEDNAELDEYLNESIAGERKRSDLIKLAALVHDIGKPDTRLRQMGRISFHGHEHMGKQIVRIISKNLKLSTHERHIVEDVVRWHLRPGYLSNFKKPTERAIYRYFRDAKEEAVSIALVSLADQRATRGPATTEIDQKHHEKICLNLLKRYFDKKKEKPFTRLINGHDLIKELKLKPSPLFNRILTEVEEKQSLGKFSTKKDALKLARKIATAKH